MSEANEAVRALSAKETIELIGTDLAAFADGGPNRRKEDIELGRTAGLDIEMISARWDEAERVVSLPPIEVVVLPPQGKAEMLTALPAQNEEDRQTRPSVSKRRSLAPDPSEEVLESKKAEASFSVSDAQPTAEQAKNAPLRQDDSLVLGSLLDRQFSPSPEAPKIVVPIRLRNWNEVQIPKSATDIEALTYVPGLVGDIVEWIVAGARRPNRVMALGVALGVVGTLIGRRVEGPTGLATHLYIFILAPTGWGKDWPLWCGNKLMIAVGAKELLGPAEFVSGRGMIKFLKRNPLTLCFVDELGDVFQLINGQKDNPWVTDLIGHLKKLYNSWEIIITAESMKEESVTINHPAVTIVGACTPQSLFEALKPKDVEGGFANRPMLLPFEGFKRPPERDVPDGMEEPPGALIKHLKALWQKKDLMDKSLSEIEGPAQPVLASDRQKIVWANDVAKAAYFAFSREMDQWEQKDRRKFDVGMRATENAVRCATNVAAGCFSPSVNQQDIEWAVKWSRVSFEAADGGLKKYMKDYFEFPKFCEEIVQTIQSAGGFMSHRDLGRHFRRHMKHGNEYDRAIAQLKRESRITHGERPANRGPAATGFFLVTDAGNLSQTE